jgi:hypothetical protein
VKSRQEKEGKENTKGERKGEDRKEIKLKRKE